MFQNVKFGCLHFAQTEINVNYNGHRLIWHPQNSHFVRIIPGTNLDITFNIGINTVTSQAICSN